MTSLPQKYEKNSIIKGFSLFFLEKSVIMRDLGQQNAENLAEISSKQRCLPPCAGGTGAPSFIVISLYPT